MKDKSKLKITSNCKIGNTYKKVCVGDEVCKPVEGSFATECEVRGCKKFN